MKFTLTIYNSESTRDTAATLVNVAEKLDDIEQMTDIRTSNPDPSNKYPYGYIKDADGKVVGEWGFEA
jgi:hypothetical protein